MENPAEKTFEELYRETCEDAQMVSTGSWHRYMEMLTGWRDEAYEAHVGCMSNNPNVERSFKQRFLQREAVVRGSQAWAENAIRNRDSMTKEIQEEIESA